ncbi:hypothetical protein ACFL34_02410, partial [Candidatus Sumerlaeota bacterium]
MPNGSDNHYSARRDPATDFPTDPAGGTALSLSDDSYRQVNLTGGAQAPFFGQIYSSFYVSSNGYITFGSGDTDGTESLYDHFRKPRISALFDDLMPRTSTVSWRQLPDRVAITWDNVRQYSSSDSNNFQIEIHFDGRITLTHLRIDAADDLVGLSAGLGVPGGFAETDLSEFARDWLRAMEGGVLDPDVSIGVDLQYDSNGMSTGSFEEAEIEVSGNVAADPITASATIRVVDHIQLDHAPQSMITGPGPFALDCDIYSVLDIVRAELKWAASAGAYNTAPLAPQADHHYTTAIPDQPVRTLVDYFFEIEDASGRVMYFPSTDSYAFRVKGTPGLTASPSALNFVVTPDDTQTLELRLDNVGTWDTDWIVQANTSFTNLDIVSGTLDDDESDTISLMVETPGAPSGYMASGEILIASDDPAGPLAIPVTIRLQAVARTDLPGYTIDRLRSDKLLYSDDTESFIHPIDDSLLNQLYIKTKQADSDTTGSNFLSFHAGVPVTVYLAVDDRMTTPPAWLQQWSASTQSLLTAGPNPTRRLYTKNFPIGDIVLGGNRDDGMAKGLNMYSVIIVPDQPAQYLSDFSTQNETFCLDPTHARPYPLPLLEAMCEEAGLRV